VLFRYASTKQSTPFRQLSRALGLNKQMKSKYTISIIALIVLSIYLAPYEYRWVLIYGSEAEKISKNMLVGKSQELPNWALDLTITSNTKHVIFLGHHHKNIFAYSPESSPVDEINWSHVWGDWYFAEI
jgi:hypothetical protein